MEAKPTDQDLRSSEFVRKRGLERVATELRPMPLAEHLGELAASASTSVTNVIKNHNQAEMANPIVYENSYSDLKWWLDKCLAKYRMELYQILYPVFVWCYISLLRYNRTKEAFEFFNKHRGDHELSHFEDIRALEAIKDATHIKASEAVRNITKQKFLVRLCNYSFQLLVRFLQEMKFLTLLSLIENHLYIRITGDQPTDVNVEDYGFNFYGEKAPSEVLADYGELKLEVEPLRILGELEVSNAEAAGASAAAKKKGKEKEKDEEEQHPRRLPPKHLSKRSFNQLLEDARLQVSLSAHSMPSTLMYTFLNTHEKIHDIALADDASRIAGACADSTIQIWDLKASHERTCAGEAGAQAQVSGSTAIASGSSKASAVGAGSGSRSAASSNKPKPRGSQNYDWKAREWNLDAGQGTDTVVLRGHAGPVYSVKFSPDKQWVLSGSADGTARLWNLQTASNVVVYREHVDPVWDVDFSCVGYYFATASGRAARLWTTDRVHSLRLFVGHASDVSCVRLHPNCKYLATGSWDHTVRLWDVHNGDCVRILSGHKGHVSCMAVSPDGRYVASASQGVRLTGLDPNRETPSTILLHDIASGKIMDSYEGHDGPVHSLDFCHPGVPLVSKEVTMPSNVLASGGADCTVRLWDIARRRPKSSVPVKDTGLPAVAGTSTAAVGRGAVRGAKRARGGRGMRGGHRGGGRGAVTASATLSVDPLDPGKVVADGVLCVEESDVASFPPHSSDETVVPGLPLTLRTRETPVYQVKFTYRNLLLAAGVYPQCY